MRKDTRPDPYLYWKQLLNHLKTQNKDNSVFFDGSMVYPRQFEIHLPGNTYSPCNLHCSHCAGKLFDKSLGKWELDGLILLENLKGKIPYHIYGGAYTEPLLNPFLMAYLTMTKKYDNYFGIHTNGTIIKQLHEQYNWIDRINEISANKTDYLSIAIDAGFSWSWGKVKGTRQYKMYSDIIEALQLISKSNPKYAIRLCYLISEHSNNMENFVSVINLSKELGLDSCRFSIPFENYNKSFDNIRKNYKPKVEQKYDNIYYDMLKPLLSTDKQEKPYIFYTGPEFTDIDKYTFKHCIYGYYQITIGADGYMYKCSTTATPTAKQSRLSKITTDIKEFEKILMRNYNKKWDCQKQCFENKVRCNRMGLEINLAYKNLGEINEFTYSC